MIKRHEHVVTCQANIASDWLALAALKFFTEWVGLCAKEGSAHMAQVRHVLCPNSGSAHLECAFEVQLHHDVSGLPSSKVHVCSSIIKDTAEAKPDGNRAIFSNTKSNALSPDQKWPRSDIIKSEDKTMPKCLFSAPLKPQPLLL